MARRHFVFAGGGTGGHLYPGLAVADVLHRLAPDADITFLTTDRPLDRRLLSPTPFAQQVQPVRPFTLSPVRLPTFLARWRQSLRHARQFLRNQDVYAVLGLGGYAAGPAVVAAHRLKIRNAILNPDLVPGRANRHLAPRCRRVFLQFEATRSLLPANANPVTVGCPIRMGFQHPPDPAAARQHFGLDVDRPTLLVTGASQGARTINEALLRVWPVFRREHPDWQMLHLTGEADFVAVRQSYQATDPQAHALPFTTDMPAALNAADLVISRAGASTLAELTALAKPSILLPYPFHRDQHQRHNAEQLTRTGAAILLDDHQNPARNGPPILDALLHFADPDHRATAAAAARSLARPDAADRVAQWLLASPNAHFE